VSKLGGIEMLGVWELAPEGDGEPGARKD
jgi:hypothetical protein